jgi:SAM-dependent methyltransferase
VVTKENAEAKFQIVPRGEAAAFAGIHDVRAEQAQKLATDLRGGRRVTDFQFDQIYPTEIRALSKTHWTPVEVAIRAAELLVRDSATRVLDVGSGSGKFCLVGALSSPGQFTGVEQRDHLVGVARQAAQELKLASVEFVENNMTELDWANYDAFYLFNPFYENIMKVIRIDEAVSLNLDKYNRYIEAVRTKLRLRPPGTQVATYHGFGGEMPPGYGCIVREAIGSSFIEVWRN